jgi:hypothetical protein
MVAMASLLDVIAGPASAGVAPLAADERTHIANEMVAATLDEHRHIEAMDTFGPRNKSRRFLTEPTAATFRKMHEEWLERADALLARCRTMHESGHTIARLQELKEAALSTRTLLKITIEGIERGMEQIRQGNYVTLEEARRELRAKAGR